MPQPKSHCIHGHAYTPENTRYAKTKGGYTQRQCRTCCNARSLRAITLRYRNDVDFRESVKSRARNWYAAHKAPLLPPSSDRQGQPSDLGQDLQGGPSSPAPSTLPAQTPLG